MRIEQQNLKSMVFTLGSEKDNKELLLYLTRYGYKLTKTFVILKGEQKPSHLIIETLKQHNICFTYQKSCQFNYKSIFTIKDFPCTKTTESDNDILQLNRSKSSNNLINTKIREFIKKPVRSGFSYQTENDLTILSQINNGSEITVFGNLEVFGLLDGKITCNGDYMLLRKIGQSGTVIFNNIILDKNKFQTDKTKIVKLVNKQLSIEEL